MKSNLKIYHKKYFKKIGIEALSSGGFARIYHIQDFNHNDYAMKEIALTEDNDINENDIKKEINIMKDIKSENSIKIIDDFKENYNYYIIMEKCDINLYNFLKTKENKKLNENEVKDFLYQMNNVFKILYEKNIVHRDISLKNILIKYNKINKKPIYILSDYGLSRYLSDSLHFKTKYAGTKNYMAPELVKNLNNKDSDIKFTNKCDIFSFGVVIYYCLKGCFPFNNDEELFHKQLGYIADDYDLDILVKGMLRKDEKKRFDWKQYFQSNLFKNNNYINDNSENNNGINNNTNYFLSDESFSESVKNLATPKKKKLIYLI